MMRSLRLVFSIMLVLIRTLVLNLYIRHMRRTQTIFRLLHKAVGRRSRGVGLIFLVFWLGTSCGGSLQRLEKIQYQQYEVSSKASSALDGGFNNSRPTDSTSVAAASKEGKAAAMALQQMLDPYSDSVQVRMNEVIAVVATPLEKKSGESTLGNIMTDAMLAMANRKFDQPVDAAFINSGGIRINQVPVGPLTRGKVFEMMPFDNLLLVQEMKGSVLLQFLQHIARGSGWPAAGIVCHIRNRQVEAVWIQGVPLDTAKTYRIANSDYVINGGDGVNMLRNLPTQNKGYLLRDALLAYFGEKGKANIPLRSQLEGRIVQLGTDQP